ncbi:hypothetical protein CPAR01_14220 [Colletotrichum paranaense]|uniref:Uncharacterized protein n=2 Tax=Colletotrichum acutatum species complex TaxID=2707335 RepID=A0AAI9XRU2_9PEZI|nr:uncharacterized protein CPAR01_14220 [Colletotrichum paranaense]KAK1461414.1 hypothetical protein CMEL01_14368 [Colletotrichum melonis]KAK1522677.1 hypothetical protein CPAR01_14220 [Colletotrichum paranaense]
MLSPMRVRQSRRLGILRRAERWARFVSSGAKEFVLLEGQGW